MFKFSNFSLLLLSSVLVTGTFHSSEEITTTQDAKKTYEQQEPEVYRLPDHVTPQSYDLRIAPDIEKSTFSGKILIQVLIKLATQRIELHSKNLKITSLRVVKNMRLVDSNYTLEPTNDLLIIETSNKFSYNTEYTVVIEFEGILEEKVTGFYKSSYIIDGKQKWLATTQFEPTYAREAFPCFDEPRFKAPFIIQVARYRDQKAISNMPRDAVLLPDPSIGYRVWEKFQQSPPMSTYLVAFMVSDYSYITNTEGNISIWTRKNVLPQATYALNQSTKLLSRLQDYVGISYKLPKLDVVAVPDLSFGAMENWGMTTYKEKYIVMDEAVSSELQKTIVTLILSHEFSHQWFGDLITPAWWDFTWLNEGFATYFEYFNAAEVEPTWKLDQLFVIENVQAALWQEVVIQRAMTTSITTISEIKNTFDVISYEKAGSVIRMLEHIVSPSAFRVTLHDYLKNSHEKRAGTVVPEDLFEEFNIQAYRCSPHLPPHVTVSQIMKTWTENIGYPLITVKRNYTTGKVEITQSTYTSPRAPEPVPHQEWIVPISYTTKSELKFSEIKPTFWSFANKIEIVKKEVSSQDWIILNLQQSAYYRVNYDRHNWHFIIKHLHEKPEEIHVLNRAQLIDDSLALASDAIICYHAPLHLIKYLPKEKDMIPWYSAVTALNRLYSELEDTSAQGMIQNYFIKIIEEPFNNFGFDIKPTDDHVTKMVKPLFVAFACRIEFSKCVVNALEEYKKNNDDLNKIQPDLKKLVFCNALTHSGDQVNVFNKLWRLYLTLDSTYDKSLVLTSLSCVTEYEIIKKLLSKLIDSKNDEIRKSDRTVILRTFFSQIAVVTGTLAFLHDKVLTISELDEYGLSTLEEFLKAIENQVKTEHQLQLLENLEEKFQRLDKKKLDRSAKIFHSKFQKNKFAPLMRIIHKARTKAVKTIEERIKKAAIIGPIIQDFLQPRTTAPFPEPTEVPSSGFSVLAISSWLHFVVASLTSCYGTRVLQVL